MYTVPYCVSLGVDILWKRHYPGTGMTSAKSSIDSGSLSVLKSGRDSTLYYPTQDSSTHHHSSQLPHNLLHNLLSHPLPLLLGQTSTHIPHSPQLDHHLLQAPDIIIPNLFLPFLLLPFPLPRGVNLLPNLLPNRPLQPLKILPVIAIPQPLGVKLFIVILIPLPKTQTIPLLPWCPSPRPIISLQRLPHPRNPHPLPKLIPLPFLLLSALGINHKLQPRLGSNILPLIQHVVIPHYGLLANTNNKPDTIPLPPSQPFPDHLPNLFNQSLMLCYR